MTKLRKPLTKLHRLKLKEASKHLKVTVKKRKADGSVSVSMPQVLFKPLECQVSQCNINVGEVVFEFQTDLIFLQGQEGQI